MRTTTERTKTEDLHATNFGTRPALKKRTENDAVRKTERLFSNAEWPFAVKRELPRNEEI